MDNNFVFLYWDDPIWDKKEDDQKPQKHLQHNSSQDQLNSDTFCNQYRNRNKADDQENDSE